MDRSSALRTLASAAPRDFVDRPRPSPTRPSRSRMPRRRGSPHRNGPIGAPHRIRHIHPMDQAYLTFLRALSDRGHRFDPGMTFARRRVPGRCTTRVPIGGGTYSGAWEGSGFAVESSGLGTFGPRVIGWLSDRFDRLAWLATGPTAPSLLAVRRFAAAVSSWGCRYPDASVKDQGGHAVAAGRSAGRSRSSPPRMSAVGCLSQG
jgi:hypothetical protein